MASRFCPVDSLWRGAGLIAWRGLVCALWLSTAWSVGQTQAGSPTGGSSQTQSAAGSVPDVVRGQVVNAITGLPVPRALVRFNGRAVLSNQEGGFEFDRNTDSNGNFLVIKPGFYASPEALDVANVYVQTAQLGSSVRLPLYPEGLVMGTVSVQDGTPLEGITVMARRIQFTETGRSAQVAGQTVTDAHGNFRLPLQAGDYSIQTAYLPHEQWSGMAVLPAVVSPGADGGGSVRVRSGNEQHFDLRPAMAPVHVVGVDMEAGAGGYRGVLLRAKTRDGASLVLRPAGGREAGGEMKVEIPEGSYTLTARRTTADGPEVAEAQITMPNHDISGVPLRFTPSVMIPVELAEADGASGSAPSLTQMGLTLENVQQDAEPENAVARLSSQGAQGFGFAVSPGSYRLQARSGNEWYVVSALYGTSDLLQQELAVTGGTAGLPVRLVVSNQTGTVQGSVKLNGAGVSAWVYLIPSTPSANLAVMVRSNVDGTFSTTRVPPGGYRVLAFERRHSIDLRDQDALASFSNRMEAVTVKEGKTSTVTVDAVPGAEMLP